MTQRVEKRRWRSSRRRGEERRRRREEKRREERRRRREEKSHVYVPISIFLPPEDSPKSIQNRMDSCIFHTFLLPSTTSSIVGVLGEAFSDVSLPGVG